MAKPAAEAAERPPVEPAPPPSPLAAYEWFEMDTAPQDGRGVYLTDEPMEAEHRALWSRTRRMVNGRWEPWAGWVDPMTRRPVLIEPFAWRPE